MSLREGTPDEIAEVPLTEVAIEAFREHVGIACRLFPADKNPTGHRKTLKTVWRIRLDAQWRRIFRICDWRSNYATRMGACGVADQWVTQLLRQVVTPMCGVLSRFAAVRAIWPDSGAVPCCKFWWFRIKEASNVGA